MTCILGQTFLERYYAVFDTSELEDISSTGSDNGAIGSQNVKFGLAFAPWTLD